MRLISFSEYEAGVIAIGGAPFGILAIGAFPVGVIAIGIVPVGLLALACGAGVGLGCFSCGVGVGAYVRAVGLALGGDAFAVGWQLPLVGDRPSRDPVLRVTVEPEQVLATGRAHWVESRLDDGGELCELPAPVVMSGELRQRALELAGKPVHAELQATRPPRPEPAGYRESAAPSSARLRCTALEDARPRIPWGDLLWYGVRMLLVGAVVAGIVGYFARERLALTRMTRVAEARWAARPARVEGLHVPPDTECSVAARLRSDGTERLHADLLVQCGSLTLFDRQLRSDCTVVEVPRAGGHAYRLRCTSARVPSSEDSDGNVSPEQPGLELDTLSEPGRVRIYASGPPPMSVGLEVDELSAPVDGAPLLAAGRDRLDVP